MSASPRALEFRDPARGLALQSRLNRAVARAGREVTVMHVCGSHEQAIARYGLRARFPPGLRVLMGPGCPVCVTDTAAIDACIALARKGIRVVTYGDMLRVPGRDGSLDDARAQGARVEVIYAATQAAALARTSSDPLVFFATGFETTAVATAAVLLADAPANLFVLSAHKWVPAAMEAVASTDGARVEGYLAAGHAATITGSAVFEGFVARYGRPVVVAGFEPLDLLAGLTLLVEEVAEGRATLLNAFPRCVSREGNRRAMGALAQVFDTADGEWRGIARIAGGELRLRPDFARHDAELRFAEVLREHRRDEPAPRDEACVCGAIMTGRLEPSDCALFGTRCRPSSPVGACMVSSEGACRIWFESGAEVRR